jgi:cholesterol transport system auxiliary component
VIVTPLPRASVARTLRLAVAASAMLALAGCLSLGDSTNVTVHSPRLSIPAQDAWPTVSWPLVVVKPLASDALDSTRIAVRPQPGTLQVYKGAIWSDPVPDLLQTQLVRAFEDSGRIVAVGRQASGMRGDFALLLDIRQFEAVYADPAQAPAATIEVQAKLLANPSSRVLASRTFRVAVPASDAKIPAVMVAFDGAMAQAIGEIVGWTLVTGQANAQSVGPNR